MLNLHLAIAGININTRVKLRIILNDWRMYTMNENLTNKKMKYKNKSRLLFSKLIIISIIITCLLVFSSQSFAQTQEVPSNVKNEITEAIKEHIQKLKTYTTEIEDNYFKQYTDIRTSAYRGFIGRLIHTGITKGTSSNTFSPKVEINGGQFVTLLLRAMGYELKAANGQQYYTPYIAKARQLAIIEHNEMLNPLRTITQKEAARIVVKAVELWDKIEMNPYFGEVIYKFEGTWGEAFKPYIKKAHASGIMTLDLKTGIFEADRPLTREEMSMVIVKFVEKSKRTPYDRDKKDVFIIRGQYSHWQDNKVFNTIPEDYRQTCSSNSLDEYFDKYFIKELKGRQSVCFFEPSNPDFSRIIRGFLEYEKVCHRAFAVVSRADRFAEWRDHEIKIFFSPEKERDFWFYTGRRNMGYEDISITMVPSYSPHITISSTLGIERQKRMFDVIKDVYKVILGKGKGLDTVIGWYENTIFKCTDDGGTGQQFLGDYTIFLNDRKVEVAHGGGARYVFRLNYKK